MREQLKRRKGWLAQVGIVSALLAVPSLALAIDLTTAGGFLFDIDASDDGAITDGTDDAFDNSGEFWVDGTRYAVGGAAHTTSLGGRQIELAEKMMSGLAVRRLVYVPPGGGDYARFAEVFENRGATDITATVRYEVELGGWITSLPSILETSSGDLTFDASDDWFVAEPHTAGAPFVSVVTQGLGSRLPITVAEQPFTDEYEWEYELTVPAGGRAVLVWFSVQASTQAAARAEAVRLASLPEDAVVGLDPYAADVLNISLSGAPVVSFTGPSEVDEGAEVTVEATIVDLEEDPVTWSWDLDGDGTFGELPDTSTYVVPAGTTDGDSVLEVAIEASDGTNSRIVTKTIQINNVAPIITSEPPTSASGAEYQYQVEVDEPGGVHDPLAFRLGGSVPPGMQISDTGLVTWTPPPTARGRTYTAVVRVLDDDLGQDIQTWDIVVGLNTAPEPPTPTSPIELVVVSGSEPVTLVAENGSDPDGDRLTYSFQISATSTFDGEAIGSGDVAEGEGTTSWTTEEPLAPGPWYWRVSASDGSTKSPYRFGSFLVGEPEQTAPDAGVQPGADGGVGDGGLIAEPAGGCSATPGSNGAGLPFTLIAALVFFLLRRREAN